MKKIFCFLFLLTGMVSFAQENDQKPKVNPEIKRFVYQGKTQILKRPYDSLYFDIDYAKGNTIVFKYYYRASETDMIADDEYTESCEFEIAPPKGNSFVISAPQFVKNKVIYNRSCFCPDAGIRQIKEGTINGKKVNKNTWLVTFDIVVEPRPGRNGNPERKQFKGYFKPGNLMF